jgi:uncharacterized repeat protein (TIGR03803 family)
VLLAGLDNPSQPDTKDNFVTRELFTRALSRYVDARGIEKALVQISRPEEWIMKNTQQHRRMQLPAASAALVLAAVLVSAVITAQSAQADTFTTLVNFNGTNGASPYYMSLVQGTNGNLYGTTEGGGANNGGTVFRVTPSGTLTTLYNFCAQTGCTDGYEPYAGLVLGTDGNFYGTTYEGGANDAGTVFKITSAGVLTVLHSFNISVDGAFPYAALIEATNGKLYGTTSEGGANGFGTVFSITTGGTLTTLASFPDGYSTASLVQGANGIFYGTTFDGGPNHAGTVFSITAGGTLTTLYNFCSLAACADGSNPLAALIQATNGDFYGTTYQGGTGGGSGDGTVFSITPGGTLTTLHSFDGANDGEVPYAGLIQASNGTFYGTTENGGPSGAGTVFSITSGGKLTTLATFSDITGGGYFPEGGLLQATNGTLYGTTTYGTTVEGGANDGIVFSLAVGEGPFVKTLPTSGNVGSAVTILGTNLTGATSVTFNGTAATFTVVSKSEITTTVPTGATTGKVKVVTPSRTLTSNVNFRVTP